MEPKLSLINNEQEWNKQLEGLGFRTIFHTWEWSRVIKETFKWLKQEYLLYEDNEQKAAIPFFCYKNKMNSLPFCEYGGPVLSSSSDSNRIWSVLKEQYKDRAIKMNMHPVTDTFNNGDKQLKTYFLRLSDDPYKRFRKETRRIIKKSEFEVSSIRDERDLQGFYKIYSKTMRRHGALCEPYMFFKKMNEHLKPEIKICLREDKLIGGSVFLKYGNIVHYFKSAFEPEAMHENPAYSVLWNAINEFSREKYEILDLGGTREGSGLEIFKSGWGGERHDITRLSSNCNFDYPSENNFSRRIWKQIPLVLIPKLSVGLHRWFF